MNIFSDFCAFCKRSVNTYFLGIAAIIFIVIIAAFSHFRPFPPFKHSFTGIVPLSKKTDSKGTVYTQIKGTFLTKEQLASLTDSIAHALGVKPKNVKGITTVITEVDTQWYPKNVYIDTGKHSLFALDSAKDYYISYRGSTVNPEGVFKFRLTPDTATYITTLTKHFFKANDYKVNIYHSNSLFIPSFGSTYSFREPKTVGCIGPFLGVAYNGGFVPVVGIGVTLNLFGIKAK